MQKNTKFFLFVIIATILASGIIAYVTYRRVHTVRNWSNYSSIKNEMSSQDCSTQGGTVVNTIGPAPSGYSPANVLGKVTGMMCPCVCLKNQALPVTLTGTLTKNNPGMEKDVWYLVYEKPGAPALSVKLIFTSTSICQFTAIHDCATFLPTADRVSVEGRQSGNEVTVETLTVLESKKTLNDTSSWQTYHNEQYGFEVKYPEDWFATHNTGTASGVAVTGDESYFFIGSDPGVRGIEFNIMPLGSSNLALFSSATNIDDFFVLMKRDKEGKEVKFIGESMVDGRKSLLFEERFFIFKSQNYSWNLTVYFQDKNDIYRIIFLGDSAVRNLFDQILSTFKFIK